MGEWYTVRDDVFWEHTEEHTRGTSRVSDNVHFVVTVSVYYGKFVHYQDGPSITKPDNFRCSFIHFFYSEWLQFIEKDLKVRLHSTET